MDAAQAKLLEDVRRKRGFDAAVTIEAKAVLLERYARASGVRGVVVGVSGGVDSAVTLALCVRAARRRGSAIERVVAALLPLSVDEGATGQSQALARGREVCARCRRDFAALEVLEADLGAAHAAIKEAMERGLGTKGDAWAAGQLVSTTRTPALYYATSLLTAAGFPAVLVGTTNRDEGAYLGFFGKASDGMVDIQLVGDLHKSEIYACARALDVPRSVIDVAPTGDTYDGKTDREMIGASYDEVELFLAQRCVGATVNDALAHKLEARHAANAHKYIGDSPAIFLDVWERAVPGGWREQPTSHGRSRPLDLGKLVAPFDLEDVVRDISAAPRDVSPHALTVGDAGEAAVRVVDLLSARECDALVAAFARVPNKVAVGAHGTSTIAGAGVGSWRASTYSTSLAALVWERLAPVLPRVRVLDEVASTDHDDHPVWRAVGVNPLFRFMQSAPNGFLVPHTDSTYDSGDGRRTLMSVIIALDSGGATHLLVDDQRNIPVRERVFVDDTALARDSRVLTRVTHEKGCALVLDHRVPHEGARDRGHKILMRTDIVFERCASAAFASAATNAPDHSGQSARSGRARDPFYAALDDADAERAGWFDDGARDPDVARERDPRWLVTPMHKLALSRASSLDDDSLADPRPLVALVTTGALCPVHRGHIELMQRAREALMQQGFAVVGGWLAPDHDRYVSMKCGADAVNAGERVRLCEDAVADSEWLMVDPWAALHVDRAVNFTDIILRLERVLAHHVRSARPVRVAYVFGSDNARFAGTFRHRGLAVCVPRPVEPASTQPTTPTPTLTPTASDRVIVARAGVAASSSAVRSGDLAALPDPVRARWRQRNAAAAGHARAHILLRDEGAWAVAPGAVDAYARFRDGVVAAIRAAFDGSVDVEVTALAEQRARLVRELAGERAFSLDPCLPGDANLAISRCFDVGARAPRRALVARPGHPALAVQLAALPRGDFVLVDDDSVSGTTLAAVRAMLPNDIRIIRELALCDLRKGAEVALDAGPRDVVDLVDCRDFLAGARDAGLVLALHGRLVRAPYVLPYARPADRSSIPIARELEFSRAIWSLNARFFDEQPARVADTGAAFRALCHELDFDDDVDMRAVCAWHLR